MILKFVALIGAFIGNNPF